MTDAERDFLRDLRRVMNEHGVKLKDESDNGELTIMDRVGEIYLPIDAIYDELNP